MTKQKPEAIMATVARDALAHALGVIASVVKTSNTIPILSHVLLRCNGAELTLVGSNLDMQVSIVVPVACDNSFAFTVDAHRLSDIARACAKGAQVIIETELPKVAVKSGRSRWALNSLPAEDFPNFAVGEMPHGFTHDAKALAGILKRVRPFEVTGSEQQVRYYLAGTFLHSIGGKAHFVATNGNALVRVVSDIDIGEAPGIIIPSGMGALICLVCDDATEEAEICYSASKISLTLGTMTIVSKLIDGTYPDYSRVIPTANDKRAVVEARGATEALRRATLLNTEKVRAARLDCEKGKILFSASSPEYGAASDELPCEYDGDPLIIGFNAKFFTEMLAATGSENVTIHLADADAAALFKETPEGNFTGVLMPMRV